LILVIVSFAVQKLFNSRKSQFAILVLVFWAAGILFRKHFLCLYIQGFSSSSFKVLHLTFKSLIHFELIFVQGKRWGLFLVFCMWISSFPNTICFRDCLFSKVTFWYLCQKWDNWSCMGLFLDLLFYSIDQCVCFCANTMLFLLLWLCHIISFRYCDTSSIVLFNKYCFGHSESFTLPYKR
jgi:hypothetical protein